MLSSTFEISDYCCAVMKKQPARDYAKQTGRMPILAMLASESQKRTKGWIKTGCNAYELKHPQSQPMAFWTEQDVLLYIREKKLPICSVYGEIVTDDEENGQITLADVMDSELFDFGRPTLHTTGCERTGCMFCGYGCHLEKPPNRFEKMKITHPKQYEYIMRGGHWKYRVFNFKGEEICLRHCSQEQIEKWVESNKENARFKIEKGDFFLDGTGLGYREVIDWINENGNMNIKY